MSVANLQGVKTTAVLSRMTDPIGNMIGNALEVAEVIECLHGGGPKPLTNLTEQLGKSSVHVLHVIVTSGNRDNSDDYSNFSLTKGQTTRITVSSTAFDQPIAPISTV